MCQDKQLVSPVFAAHMLSKGLPFELRADYGGHPLPTGEQSASLLYKHLEFYVNKMRMDLKNIGEWDRSLQHVGLTSLASFKGAMGPPRPGTQGGGLQRGWASGGWASEGVGFRGWASGG